MHASPKHRRTVLAPAFHIKGQVERPRAANASCERVRSRSTRHRSDGLVPRVLHVEHRLRRSCNCDRRQREVFFADCSEKTRYSGTPVDVPRFIMKLNRPSRDPLKKT